MSKGKTKTGSRSGSDSNNASRASASDRAADRKRMLEGKSVKLGSVNDGKRKDWTAGGRKRETRG